MLNQSFYAMFLRLETLATALMVTTGLVVVRLPIILPSVQLMTQAVEQTSTFGRSSGAIVRSTGSGWADSSAAIRS